MENTNEVNRINNNIIQHHIMNKIGSQPYYPDPNLMYDTLTDQDSFPYTRYYRGKYYLDDPVVASREAGYREINNNCYSLCLANYLDPY